MLENKDREKIEKYVEKMFDSIYEDVKKNIKRGMSNQEVIDRTVRLTVNKLAPESKMILSSTYNMLMEKTLAKPLYQETANKAAFYSRDILRDLNSKFIFDVPDHIDYEESHELIKKLIAAGVIVIVGGVISIKIENVVPFAISVAGVIAGIMLLLLRDMSAIGGKQDIGVIVKDYLENVKISLMSWIHEIEKYYDDEIRKLEEGMQ